MSTFLKFLIFRCFSCLMVQTWFVPDETWQVTEIAHYWVYGYGYLCWEWKEAIRSIIYPGFFSFLYYILSLLKLDYTFILIQFPRLVSSIIFAVGDYHVLKTFLKLFGKMSQGWVAVFLCTSWFLSYCAPRTLTSCAEMTFLAVTLSTYPWHHEKESTSTWYLLWGGIGCAIRPTLAIFLLPYCVKHLILCNHKCKILLKYIIDVCVILCLTVLLDSCFYGQLTFVPWNFLKFNLISGLSSHYGTHSWHWYFTQGVPVVCGVHLIPLIYGIKSNCKKYLVILGPCFVGLIIYSLLGHKEFRFLLPIVPLLLAVGGDSVHSYLKSFKSEKDAFNRSLGILFFLVVTNVLLFLYMALIHQRGPFDVIHQLKNLVINEPKPNVLFLTPCHSTPLYSHLHINVPVRFLTCEPNLQNIQAYKDEADIFFDDPNGWLQNELFNKTDKSSPLPTHIVMYDTLSRTLQQFLKENKYKLLQEIFSSHFYDGNRGSYFHIYSHFSIKNY